MAAGISPFNLNVNVNSGMSPYAGGMSGMGFSPMGQMGQMGQMQGPSSMMAGLLQQNQMMMSMIMQEMMMLLMGLMSNGGAGGANSALGGLGALGGGGGGAAGGGGGVSGGGATATPTASSPTASVGGGSAAGKTLAAAAEKEANAEHSTGYCFRGVSRSLHSIGVDTHGEAAYMAADQLAKNPKVKEVKVDRDKLSSLPPGAIVVWAQGPGHQYGHISVALGNGKEASDHVQSQIKDLTGHNGSYRVFMPV